MAVLPFERLGHWRADGEDQRGHGTLLIHDLGAAVTALLDGVVMHVTALRQTGQVHVAVLRW